MIKILIILMVIMTTGCAGRNIVKEQVYIEKINQCKELPMPGTYNVLRWDFEDEIVVIDGEPFYLLGSDEYSSVIFL